MKGLLNVTVGGFGPHILIREEMNTDEIQIEMASLSDASKIYEIQQAAFKGQAKIYNNFDLPPLKQSLESIREEFKDKTFLKVVWRGRIIGSVRFKQCDGGRVTLERLIVCPEKQNDGIGTKLLKAVESFATVATSFNLITGNKSHRNIHLYQKMGYRIIKRESTPLGIEILHMKKEVLNQNSGVEKK